MDKIEILKHHFGHESFRPLQERAVDTILSGRDLLMILPTGGGKSLCYQLPTMMMSGITVVVSPLLALMHDQVTALLEMGIEAAMLGSTQSLQERRKILQRLRRGEIKLLYVAPERLGSEFFLKLLTTLKINLFVIDEAHCVSEWGHEFREDYRRLFVLRQRFVDTPIAAFTATATAEVEQDIISQLRLKEPVRLRGSLYRQNLTINARYRHGDGREQLLEFLATHRNESGIIYTLSRRQTESLAAYLQAKGLLATAFHAGLTPQERRRVYEEFISDRIDTVVATVAFGMGIDKSNIRYVVHMSLPKSVESYYQEIGRAGRDGLAAETLLLFGAQDMIFQRRFIKELPDTPYRDHALDKLEAFWRIVSSDRCRHRAIADYFAESIPKCGSYCDNCLDTDIERVEITEAAQKFLAATWRSSQRFGVLYVINLLRGSRDKKILQNGHEQLSVYGIGKEFDIMRWRAIVDRLLEIGAIVLNEHKGVAITQIGAQILKGKQRLWIRQDRLQKRHIRPKAKIESLQEGSELFEVLRQLRKEIASKQGLPPYVVFSDKTLHELSQNRPKTHEEMLNIHGIGKVKLKRYGEDFLERIREWERQNI